MNTALSGTSIPFKVPLNAETDDKATKGEFNQPIFDSGPISPSGKLDNVWLSLFYTSIYERLCHGQLIFFFKKINHLSSDFIHLNE